MHETGRVSHSQGAWDTNRIYSCGFNFTLVHTKAKGQEHLSLKENWLLGWQWSHNMHQAYWKWCRSHQRVSYTGRYEPSTEHLSFLFFLNLPKAGLHDINVFKWTSLCWMFYFLLTLKVLKSFYLYIFWKLSWILTHFHSLDKAGL